MAASKKKAIKKTAPKTRTASDTGYVVLSYTGRWKNEAEFLTEFVGDYKLTKQDLVAANITWQELAMIYLDHESDMGTLQAITSTVSETLQQSPHINSVKSRIKLPISLVFKVVRKRKEFARDINLQNYRSQVCDLAGIRVLHLLKEQWLPIHHAIMETFDVQGKPVAFVDKGASKEYRDHYLGNGCVCNDEKDGYKSVHYDIAVGIRKEKTILEIQVRTIHEEAWIELDHRINYPVRAPQIVADFIDTANMLSTIADQLSQKIIMVNDEMRAKENLRAEYDAALTKIDRLVKDSKIKGKQRDEAQTALQKLKSASSPPAFMSVGNNIRSFGGGGGGGTLTFPSGTSWDRGGGAGVGSAVNITAGGGTGTAQYRLSYPGNIVPSVTLGTGTVMFARPCSICREFKLMPDTASDVCSDCSSNGTSAT